jgi:hypothetical protein
MTVRFVLSDYVDGALAQARYDKLDGTFAGRVPDCPGAVAVGTTLRECEDRLRTALEDRTVLGLDLRQRLPVIAGIDLNEESSIASLDTL